MDLWEPFRGTLYLADKGMGQGTSPVMVEDGREIAYVRWHTWTMRSRFEVLGVDGDELARGGSESVWGRRYAVRTTDGRSLVEFQPGLFRRYKGAVITVEGGRELSVGKVSAWSDRKFEFLRGSKVIGRITPTTGAFSFRPDSYAFELLEPVMSVVAAVGLAQTLRLIVKAGRQSHAGTSAAGG